MTRFRKSNEVDALQWTGLNEDEIRDFFQFGPHAATRVGDQIVIQQPAGSVLARKGDWIVRDAAGTISAVDPEEFIAGFEEINGETS